MYSPGVLGTLYHPEGLTGAVIGIREFHTGTFPMAVSGDSHDNAAAAGTGEQKNDVKVRS